MSWLSEFIDVFTDPIDAAIRNREIKEGTRKPRRSSKGPGGVGPRTPTLRINRPSAPVKQPGKKEGPLVVEGTPDYDKSEERLAAEQAASPADIAGRGGGDKPTHPAADAVQQAADQGAIPTMQDVGPGNVVHYQPPSVPIHYVPDVQTPAPVFTTPMGEETAPLGTAIERALNQWGTQPAAVTTTALPKITPRGTVNLDIQTPDMPQTTERVTMAPYVAPAAHFSELEQTPLDIPDVETERQRIMEAIDRYLIPTEDKPVNPQERIMQAIDRYVS